MFEDDAAVLDFLDHTKKRFTQFPDAATPVSTERFHRFPSHKQPDAPDSGSAIKFPATHPEGETCSGDLPTSPGATLARVVGRALGADGNPLSEARTQDNYIEDRLEVTAAAQAAIRKSMAAAGDKPFPLPAGLARELVGNAYLGMLDVSPLGGRPLGVRTDVERIDLHARQTSPGELAIWGTSRVTAGPLQNGPGARGDGRRWHHAITLTWEGRLKLGEAGKPTALAVVAEGTEQLQWNAHLIGKTPPHAVQHLPAGRPVDFDGNVRYGFDLR